MAQIEQFLGLLQDFSWLDLEIHKMYLLTGNQIPLLCPNFLIL
ncbi:hypothetical protein VL20_6052 [Microcystis panniformis FACHB-1757]|uniref:Uncharacterized protein n=1 Tax=Microcystis panniformis FACHB-1757 TaxID=1638788 RepID=A0A0K1S9M8_9CHRO|nr:hypothetical protein VL20_6052 [Microcystis panniformis FACHB-1757]